MEKPYVTIPLRHGYVVKLDEADLKEVSAYSWHRNTSKRNGKDRLYAHAHVPGSGHPGKKVLMHVLLMKPPEGYEVDHIDGDGLNNTRDNLQVLSKEEHRRVTMARRQSQKAEVLV